MSESNGRIIVCMGKSAVGKDSVVSEISKRYGYEFIISSSTRPKRNGESEGNPYFFKTNEEFEKLIDEDKLIEYRYYDTLVSGIPQRWFYGVEKSQVLSGKNYIVVLDTIGAIDFKREFGDSVIVFYLEIDDDIRLKRCISRGDYDESEYNRRKKDDDIRFSDENLSNLVDYRIRSEFIDKTVDDIMDKIELTDIIEGYNNENCYRFR